MGKNIYRGLIYTSGVLSVVFFLNAFVIFIEGVNHSIETDCTITKNCDYQNICNYTYRWLNCSETIPTFMDGKCYYDLDEICKLVNYKNINTLTIVFASLGSICLGINMISYSLKRN